MQAREPGVHVLSGLVLGIAIPPLERTFELIAPAVDRGEIIISQFAPGRSSGSCCRAFRDARRAPATNPPHDSATFCGGPGDHVSTPMMRHGSDRDLTAAMGGMIVCMLLAIGALSVRSVRTAEGPGKVVVLSEYSQASTKTMPDRATLEIGLRGSLP